jgi:hypothetical protein
MVGRLVTKCPRRWRWTWDVGLRNVAWDTVMPRENAPDSWQHTGHGPIPSRHDAEKSTPLERYQAVEEAQDWQRAEHERRTVAVARAMLSVTEPWERDNLARVLRILRAGRLVAIPGDGRDKRYID